MTVQLDKGFADALCTTIVIGYILTKKVNQFIYDDAAPPAQLTSAIAFLNTFTNGQAVQLQKSTANSQTQVVLSTTKYNLIDESVQSTPILQAISTLGNKCDQTGQNPYGAYIGFWSNPDTGQIKIVGPSRLELYTPKYRTVDANVPTSFTNAQTASNMAVDVIQQVQADRNNQGLMSKFSTIYLTKTDQTVTPIPANTLFRSIHGMTSTICLFGTDRRNIIAEIAMGNATTKVAACVACAMFMDANGLPPSAIHLGRADNWGIPTVNPSQNPSTSGSGDGATFLSQARSNWSGQISAFFSAGLTALSTPSTKHPVDPTKLALLKTVTSDIAPAVFLEALTFEDSVYLRIFRTMSWLQTKV